MDEKDFADKCIDRFFRGKDISFDSEWWGVPEVIWELLNHVGYCDCVDDNLFLWVPEPNIDEWMCNRLDYILDEDRLERLYDGEELTEEEKKDLFSENSDEYYKSQNPEGHCYLIKGIEVEGLSGRTIWVALQIGDRGYYQGCSVHKTYEDLHTNYALSGRIFDCFD